MQSGDLPYKLERHLPPNSLMSDELSPHVRMPGLRTGQSWTVPLYSPFRSPSSPIEILQAVVEREDNLTWGGRTQSCHVIVYRGDSGSGQAGNEIRGRVWVDRQGIVLRQEIAIFRSHLHFIRLSDFEARRHRRRVGRRLVHESAQRPSPAIAGLPPPGRRFLASGNVAAFDFDTSFELPRMIQFEHVTRRYGTKVAVSDLSLEIPSRRVVRVSRTQRRRQDDDDQDDRRVCCGPAPARSACAATTLPRTTAPPIACWAMCPTCPICTTSCRASSFCNSSAKCTAWIAQELRGRIAQQIDAFRLHDFVEDLTESYSHGMKQRLAFAAAMLHDPKVLVIDEPMVGLDPRSVRLVKDLLRAKAAAGQTIFMSTHLLSIAEEIADRVGIVDHGQLKFLGTFDELRETLATHETSLEHLYLSFTAGDEDHPEGDRRSIGPRDESYVEGRQP